MNKLPLRICIDIRSLETGNKYRGSGYYVKNLVLNVIKADKVNNYFFIVYGKDDPLYSEIRRRGFQVFSMSHPKIKPRFWWIYDQIKLPSLIKRINPDIYVSPDCNLPLRTSISKKIKTVVAVHDIIPLVLRQEYRLPVDRKIDFIFKITAAKRANVILTISEHSKEDIEKYLKVPDFKVKYIYGSTDESFSQATDDEILRLKKKYVKGKKYIMTVGDYYGSDPRKNYLFLVDCFSRFIKQGRNDDLTLLFVGKCGGKNNEYSRIKKKIMELDIIERIVFTDFVSDEDLTGLYSGSEAFVFPTKYEGFGLPILQAMSCGCPVVAADNTSIPEVAGRAAELFKTNNEESFLGALSKVLGGKKDYRKLGYENIKRFSWGKSAREFIIFLNDLGKTNE